MNSDGEQSFGRWPGNGFIRPCADVIAQRMGNVLMVLHLHSNRFYKLSATAGRMWELAMEGNSLSEVKEQLLREYEVEPAELSRHMEEMVTALHDTGLATIEQDPAS